MYICLYLYISIHPVNMYILLYLYMVISLSICIYPDIKAKETPAHLLHVQRAQSRAERKALLEEERRILATGCLTCLGFLEGSWNGKFT